MPALLEKSGSALVIGGGITEIKAVLILCDAGLNIDPDEHVLCMGIHDQRLLRMLSHYNFVKQ
jgi:heterodisulfide reductase subunit A-like polyferredoxin